MKTATFILSNWLCIKEGHPPFERILWCRFPFLFLEKRHASGNFEDISFSDQLEMNLRKIRNALIDCISSSTLKRSLFDYNHKNYNHKCLTRYCFEHKMGTTVVCNKQIPSLDIAGGRGRGVSFSITWSGALPSHSFYPFWGLESSWGQEAVSTRCPTEVDRGVSGKDRGTNKVWDVPKNWYFLWF